MRTRQATTLAVALAATLTVPACGQAAGGETSSIRLGYFPNVTHAPALLGVGEDLFADHLGAAADLRLFVFSAGAEATEALLTGALDMVFMGPGPTLNAYEKSGGTAIRVVAGTASGGAYLVVRRGITSAAQLRGARLASPGLGNTQDLAARAWLADHGLRTSADGGGDVAILPHQNSTILDAFLTGAVDGAWVPEPWATRLVREGGGHVLVDERDLWPGGRYVTTHLVVRTAFLERHPERVRAVLEALVVAVDAMATDPGRARLAVRDQLAAISGRAPDPEIVRASLANLEFTVDPIATSMAALADDAVALGLLDPIDPSGLYDLALLNEVLAARGRQGVPSP